MDAKDLKIGKRVSLTIDAKGFEWGKKVYGHIVSFDNDTAVIWCEYEKQMEFKTPDDIEDED